MLPPSDVKISRERQDAKSIYPADWLPVEDHFDQDAQAEGDSLKKPDAATHLQLQTIGAAIRYTVDESAATLTHGFQLAEGVIATIPCPMRHINIFREDTTRIQGQWIR